MQSHLNDAVGPDWPLHPAHIDACDDSLCRLLAHHYMSHILSQAFDECRRQGPLHSAERIPQQSKVPYCCQGSETGPMDPSRADHGVPPPSRPAETESIASPLYSSFAQQLVEFCLPAAQWATLSPRHSPHLCEPLLQSKSAVCLSSQHHCIDSLPSPEAESGSASQCSTEVRQVFSGRYKRRVMTYAEINEFPLVSVVDFYYISGFVPPLDIALAVEGSAEEEGDAQRDYLERRRRSKFFWWERDTEHTVPERALQASLQEEEEGQCESPLAQWSGSPLPEALSYPECSPHDVSRVT